MRHKIVVITIVALVAIASAATAASEPKTDEEKAFYAIGFSMSRNLAQLNLTAAELEMVSAGIADGVAGKEPKVDLKIFGPKINELVQARVKKTAEAEKKSAQAFLEKAAGEKGAKKQPSGLIYTELKAGDGKQPTSTDKVKVHYTGTLRDGTVFDSSVERGQPAEFPLNGVIACWSEGLQLMKEKGKAKLVCPSDLAYGDRGAPPKIKPGAALTFEVELLEVVPASTGGKAPPAGAPGSDPHGD